MSPLDPPEGPLDYPEGPLDYPERPLDYPEGPPVFLAASRPDFRLGDLFYYYECDMATTSAILPFCEPPGPPRGSPGLPRGLPGRF